VTLYVGRRPPPRTGRRALVGVIFFLLVWFLAWLVIGLVIRTHLESPVRYIGRSAARDSSSASLPLELGPAGPAILDPGYHEQEVG